MHCATLRQTSSTRRGSIVPKRARWSSAPRAILPSCGRLAGISAAVGVFACLAAPAHAIVNAVSTGIGDATLNGEAELILTEAGGQQFGCSGSLLTGGQYILTAGHCLTGDDANAKTTAISVSFLGGKVELSATKYFVDPSWNGSVASGDDLAIIELNSPITQISGYTIDTGSVSKQTEVLVAGYGETGTGTTGAQSNTFGTLHYGYNQYNISSSFYDEYGISQSVLLYDFENTNQAMIAPGDSGGGSFVDVDGIYELVGVHDFNMCIAERCTPNSAFGTIGGDVSVAATANIEWIDSVIGTPEPGAFALMAVGFAGLGLIRTQGRGSNRAPAQAARR